MHLRDVYIVIIVHFLLKGSNVPICEVEFYSVIGAVLAGCCEA